MPDLSVGYVEPLLRPSTAEGLRTAVRLCEDAGVDHIGVCDHVSFQVGLGFDGLLQAATILAASETLDVNVGVYLLPLRHPVLVARQLADLGVFAPGRFTFGVGLGGEDPHEVAICGVDQRTRGRRMDECMQIVRALLDGETVDHDSEFFHLEGAVIEPVPSKPVPFLVGGRSDAALRRAGRFGDGWISVFVSPRRYEEAVLVMMDAAEDGGRPAPDWRNGINIWCGVGRDADEARSLLAPAMETFYKLPYDRFERYSPAGTPAQLADALVPYAEAGCSIFNLMMIGTGVDAEVDAVAEIKQRLNAAMS
jgi:alkanesulfonate monooxygenase SsuD/methylene tetrahydromethanopterin reductase-like flavin-dependent oxidoreductase (luciferase family)